MERATLCAGALALLAGCATPGPLHVYSVRPGGEQIQDRGAEQPAADVPSFLESDERLTGFAYDPYTDHFFLRLAPGNALRVVDRPARKIKRAFVIAGVPAEGDGGDLAIRPRDGHVFLLHPREPVVLETTRLGQLRRTFPLAGLVAPPIGIAYESAEGGLAVLHADGRTITVHDPKTGAQTGTLTLDRAAGPSLGFDAARREYYAPLAGEDSAIGIFAATGTLVRRATATGNFVDVGERSFVRVF